eukprot:TRINITY_DN10180_c0_g1_i1.p1 TRINITY_DN10180_c0_g1~~TRINITY_DN10180_c0_g1_i1.p1  ORF type:complete len:191 (+),score=41.63 TRINITY_DN10180_c0_g1_i1:52-624(+)
MRMGRMSMMPKLLDEEVACTAPKSDGSSSCSDDIAKALSELQSINDLKVKKTMDRTTHVAVRTSPAQKFGAWIRGNAVTNVVAGAPADLCGLSVGMRIIEVNGVQTDPSETSTVIRQMWRGEGTVSMTCEMVVAKSKRSLAKARARQRHRTIVKEQQAAQSETVSVSSKNDFMSVEASSAASTSPSPAEP